MTRKRKRKEKEQGRSAFQNSPFTALRGVVGKPSSPQAAAPKAASHDDREDEEGLFLQSVSGARKIAPEADRDPGRRTAPAAAGAGVETEADDRDLFLRTLGTMGPAGFRDGPQEQEEDAPARSSSGKMRQLRRGTIRIGDELDLHGFLKDEALRRLEYFIASSVASGLAAVLVITGKGTNSPDGPVLPGAVSAWLRERGKGSVIEFHAAPRDKGGSGAFVVFLKKR